MVLKSRRQHDAEILHVAQKLNVNTENYWYLGQNMGKNHIFDFPCS